LRGLRITLNFCEELQIVGVEFNGHGGNDSVISSP
jgi:hypothetical protein